MLPKPCLRFVRETAGPFDCKRAVTSSSSFARCASSPAWSGWAPSSPPSLSNLTFLTGSAGLVVGGSQFPPSRRFLHSTPHNGSHNGRARGVSCGRQRHAIDFDLADGPGRALPLRLARKHDPHLVGVCGPRHLGVSIDSRNGELQ
jgi:hypothetical protein